MSLTIQSVDPKSCAVILADSTNNTFKIDAYSASSKKIWDVIRCILSVITCGCLRFESFLAVDTLYVLPSQIKEGYKQLKIPLPKTDISQETLPPLIANIQEYKPTPITPVQPVEKAAPTQQPIRIRIIEPSKTRITVDKLKEALFAKRSFSQTEYVCEEPYNAAVIIRIQTLRQDWNERAEELVKYNLQGIPTVYVFVATIPGENSDLHDEPDSKPRKSEEMPQNCTFVQLRIANGEVNYVDPNATEQNKWNIEQIQKFHSFIQEHVRQ